MDERYLRLIIGTARTLARSALRLLDKGAETWGPDEVRECRAVVWHLLATLEEAGPFPPGQEAGQEATSGPVKGNPQLVVYGNPDSASKSKRLRPGGSRGLVTGQSVRIRLDRPIGSRVHLVRYEHVEDGAYYEHRFDGAVQMWGVLFGRRRDVLLIGAEGQPLWDDF